MTLHTAWPLRAMRDPVAQVTLIAPTLGSMHWWVPLLTDINLFFGMVGSACGAIVGIHGAYVILRRVWRSISGGNES